MTRTYITAADGTLYEAISRRRKIIRRVIATAILIITAIFLSAAVIGLQRAAIEGSPRTAPTAHRERAIPLALAKNACRRAPKGSTQDCLQLFLQNPYFDSKNYTPAGPALVKECMDQYRGEELADCLTQEIG